MIRTAIVQGFAQLGERVPIAQAPSERADHCERMKAPARSEPKPIAASPQCCWFGGNHQHDLGWLRGLVCSKSLRQPLTCAVPRRLGSTRRFRFDDDHSDPRSILPHDDPALNAMGPAIPLHCRILSFADASILSSCTKPVGRPLLLAAKVSMCSGIVERTARRLGLRV